MHFGAPPGAWGATPVFFYGFDDLTALERDAVESLARVAGADVAVSLTYEAGKAALRARARTGRGPSAARRSG